MLFTLHAKDTAADNLLAKCKLGFVACDLAPDVIEKAPLAKIQAGLTTLAKANVTIPISAWLVLVKKTCWDHIDGERFDKFLMTFRPWPLSGEVKAFSFEKGFSFWGGFVQTGERLDFWIGSGRCRGVRMLVL